MIINKVQNQQNTYKSRLNAEKNNNWVYCSSLLTIPTGGLLGWKLSKDKFEKGKNTLLQRIENLEPEYINLKKWLIVQDETPEAQLWGDLQIYCSNLIVRHNEGKPTEMPNCIMFIGDDSKCGIRFYDWLCKKSNSEYFLLKGDGRDDLIEYLESKEGNINKKWHLIFVENLDKNINSQTSAKEHIAALKDVMSNCAEDYNTTIVFQTQNPSQLDTIALQPHRVHKRFDLNDIDEKKFNEYDEKMTKYLKIKDELNAIFNKVGITDKNSEEITQEFKNINEIKNKINKLKNNKNLKKSIALGIISGAVISGCIVLVHKLIKRKENEEC